MANFVKRKKNEENIIRRDNDTTDIIKIQILSPVNYNLTDLNLKNNLHVHICTAKLGLV